jgi:hypothetical protein
LVHRNTTIFFSVIDVVSRLLERMIIAIVHRAEMHIHKVSTAVKEGVSANLFNEKFGERGSTSELV